MTRLAITGRRGLSAAVSAEVDRMVRAVVAGGVRAAPPVADGSLTGVSWLADGADAVFAQAVLDAGGMLVAVLPASEYREALPAVWDGLPGRGPGGTADVVAYARSKGVPVTVLWPEGAAR